MPELTDTPAAGVGLSPRFAPTNNHAGRPRTTSAREVVIPSVVVFALSFLFLFLGMNRVPNMYDEGLVLTDAMRVAAGQMPHRDFYVNYGPAQFYILAGLFKVFGQALIVERLYDLLIKSLIVASIFAVTLRYCRRSIAVCAAAAAAAWVFSIVVTGTAMVPVTLLGLSAAILVAPVLARKVPAGRLLAAGAIAGVTALFRYEIGAGLFGVGTLVIALAMLTGPKGALPKARTFLATYWPYLAGFAAVVLPPALYYVSVAPIQPLLHDAITFPMKYYARTRGLPFLRFPWRWLDNLEIYLPIIIVTIALCGLVLRLWKPQRKESTNLGGGVAIETWEAFLFAFALLGLLMCFKGFVRPDRMQMFAAIVSSVPLTAILFERRWNFSRFIRVLIVVAACLFLLTAARRAFGQARILYLYRLSVLEELIQAARGIPEVQADWCKSKSALTAGLCFLPEGSGIPAAEFIQLHTRPGDRLFSGLERHDKIFVNDMLIYFATQRLPATRWAHFDPGLQNRYEVQNQIIRELEENAPPYIVLLKNENWPDEPNESARSSGVVAVDKYIRNRYRQVANFPHASIWERQQ